MKKNLYKILPAIILILSMLGITYVHHETAKFHAVTYLEEEILPMQSENVELKLYNFLQPIINAANVFSESGFITRWMGTEEDTKSLNAYLREKLPLIGCSGIDIASGRSEIVYQWEGTQVQMEKGNNRDDWYYRFLEDEKKANTELYYDSPSGILYIYYNMKLFDTKDNYLGVIGYRIEYNKMATLLSENLLKGCDAYFVNKDASVIIHPDKEKISDVPIYDYTGLLQEGVKTQISYSDNMDKLVGATYFSDLGIYLVVEQDINIYADQMYSGYTSYFIIIIAITFALILLNLVVYNTNRKTIMDQNTALGKALEVKKTLIYLLSHNMNNSLAVLINKVRGQGMPFLLTRLESMRKLISNILIYIRTNEEGKKQHVKRSVSINFLLEMLVLRLGEQAQDKNQNIVLDLPEEEVTLISDENLLLEALENIVDNAVKYSPPDTSIELSLRYDTQEKGKNLIITIADHGPGFSEGDKKKLFSQFARLSAKSPEGDKGNGLGMAVSKQIIELLGGSIALVEKEGWGAVFKIRFPQGSNE